MMICRSMSAGEGGALLLELLLGDAILLLSPATASVPVPLVACGGGVAGFEPFTEDTWETEGPNDGSRE